jgi:hypothetical protein
MRELQKSGKKAKVKVLKKQELWREGFDGKLQKMGRAVGNWQNRRQKPEGNL